MHYEHEHITIVKNWKHIYEHITGEQSSWKN
jgi:hypothetical protein